MIKQYKNSIASAFFTVFSCFYLIFQNNIETTLKNGLGGSKFMPRLIGILLLSFSLVQLTLSLRKESNNHQMTNICPVNRKNVFLTFAFFAIYVFALGHLGFLISTWLYLTAQIYILSPKVSSRFLKSAMIAVIADLTIYLLFTKVLAMMLPQGLLVL